ncbi:MAG TPA: hypothetical protein VMC84_02425 [Methanocella sp.]|uniref:carboxypeptidase-like regulatory domain-containing protein n=1 Tax=Methanocella sp. TaxID=2052833 RepID=UPI002B85A49A|nr:hypothetical protein [Methanocella sp.]HTY90009.1 hypothetical protein [Methanocella sp.]
MSRSLKDAIKLTGLVAAAMLVSIILPVSASLPAYTGISYPNTFWAKMDYTNTVTGKVIASSGASHGLEGAYVAIVNASNTSEEYCNTTSDASGNYSFSNVNATFYQKPDRYDPLYMIYAYKEGYGEAYSQSFGIDVATVSEPVEMWVVIPVNETKAQTSNVVSSAPTATVKPSPSPVPAESTPSPGNQFWSLRSLAIYMAVIAVVLAGAGAYLYIRRR